MKVAEGTCRFCGQCGRGQPFTEWVSDRFTNHDSLLPGDIICENCAFWFQERSEELARVTERWWPDEQSAFAANPERVKKFVKAKGRQPLADELFTRTADGGWCVPQVMRNYSHFVVNGQWRPLSKSQKAEMATLLTANPFPELAVVAVSGQKHIAFRARRNPAGGSAGWVQLEEDTIWVEPGKLRALLNVVEALMAGFGKSQIESGEYYQKLIMDFGFAKWYALEQQVKPHRGGQLLRLAIFLGQTQGEPGQAEQDEAEEREEIEMKAEKRPARLVSPGTKKPGKARDTQMSLF